MKRVAVLEIDPLRVKTFREKLCVLQQQASSRESKDFYQSIIDQLDRHRPVGPDGKHGDGDRCTFTCGCSERNDNPPPKCYHQRITCACRDCGVSPVYY